MTGTSKTAVESAGHAIVLGLCLYVTLLYLPITVGLQMGTSQSNFSQVVEWGCVLAGVLTFASGRLTQTPLAVMPALGPTLLLRPILVDGALDDKGIAVICGVSGLVVGWLALSGYRKSVLDKMPPEILLGIKAAVGTLIGATSIEMTNKFVTVPGNDFHTIYAIFIMSVIFMAFWDRVPALLKRFGHSPDDRGLYILTQAHYVIIPFLVYTLIGVLGINGPNLSAVFAKYSPQISQNGEQILAGFPLCLAMIFILITDIPGHPYEILQSSDLSDQRFGRSLDEVKVQIRNGFLCDSIGSLSSGLLFAFHVALPPPLYVSENNLVRDFKWTSGRAASVAGVLFVFTAVILQVEPEIGSWMGKYFSLGVAPVLFFIAIKMVARSMVSAEESTGVRSPASDPQVVEKRHRNFSEAIDFYIPGALMILLTFTGTGLVASLPIGVVTSLTLRYFRGEQSKEFDVTLFGLSVASVFCWFVLEIVRKQLG